MTETWAPGGDSGRETHRQHPRSVQVIPRKTATVASLQPHKRDEKLPDVLGKFLSYRNQFPLMH